MKRAERGTVWCPYDRDTWKMTKGTHQNDKEKRDLEMTRDDETAGRRKERKG